MFINSLKIDLNNCIQKWKSFAALVLNFQSLNFQSLVALKLKLEVNLKLNVKVLINPNWN